MFVQIQALLGFVRFLPMYCLHNHLFLKFFYLEFSGLFYCSVINVHFASKTLYSLALSAVLMTYFVCVSEIYTITLCLTCQQLFWFFVLSFDKTLCLSQSVMTFDNSHYVIITPSICQQLFSTVLLSSAPELSLHSRFFCATTNGIISSIQPLVNRIFQKFTIFYFHSQ